MEWAARWQGQRAHLGWPAIRLGVHALMAVLLAVILVHALDGDGPIRESGVEVATVVVAAATAVVYAVGLLPLVRATRARALVWLLVLAGTWGALLALTPDAVYLAFPLFFLAAHLLPDRAAVLAVGLLAAGAIAGYAAHRGTSFAAVLGPVLGALVAIATVLGLRAVDRESARRGVLEERERLAREIHDTLAQGLSSIQLLLGAAEPQVQGPGRDLVDQARRVAQHNLEEARRFVRALGPADLDGESLPAALDRVAATMGATFTLDGSPRGLSSTVEASLLRICQEALGNARRHADAEHVAVTLSYHDDQVALDVVDDGHGFDPDRPTGGFGLASMRSRARGIGADLTVESAPGDGTAVAVSVPAGAR